MFWVKLILPQLTFGKLRVPQKVWWTKWPQKMWQILARNRAHEGMTSGSCGKKTVWQASIVAMNQTPI
jgi:hypothetical protein